MVTSTHQKLIRSRVTFDEIEGLRITIPAMASPIDPRLLGILVGAGALVAMGWLTSRSLVYMRSHDLAAFRPPLWIVAGAFFYWGLAVVWVVERGQSRCREIIQIDGDTLVLRREGVFRVHRPKSDYLLSNVRNLRYEPAPLPGGDRRVGLSIAFDYLGSTGRFGLSLSGDESRRLIRTIKDRYKIMDDNVEPLPVERL